MFEELLLSTGRGSRSTAPGVSTASVRLLGQDIHLESRIACSATNISVSGSQFFVNGEASRLVMYGAYGLIEPGFNHRQFFDTVKQQYNVNSVRIWVNFHWANELSPFARSGGRYDLRSWSNSYFERLRDFVRAADERGIVVQVCLFDGVMLENPANAPNRWNWSPYNDARNLDNTRSAAEGAKMANTTDEPMDDEAMGIIRACAGKALAVLGLNAALPAAMLVEAVDDFAHRWQKSDRLPAEVIEDTEHARLYFGSLWGEQLCRQFGWEWRKVVFGDGSEAFGVVSPDRSLAVYPFHFMLGCMQDAGVDVTVLLSFNMLLAGSIPRMRRRSYTNVMDGVHRIVPRD